MQYTRHDFHISSYAVWEGCKPPKNRQPDFTSPSGSKYYYGTNKRGEYVIRVSNHWSGDNHGYRWGVRNIASCYWPLRDNSSKEEREERAGKAYFKDFSLVKWR
jgi:hypothetical protein